MTTLPLPGYAKYFFILANIVLTLVVLSTGSQIISPLIAAVVVAILLNPLHHKLMKLGLPRVLTAAISVLIFCLGIILLISFISTQIKNISGDFTVTTDQLIKIYDSAQKWLMHILPTSLQSNPQTFKDSFVNFLNKTAPFLLDAFLNTTAYLSMFLLFFISLFFFLYYNKFFLVFFYKLFGRGSKTKVKETADKVKGSINNYIVGLFIVITIVAILNSIGLLIIGVKHAIFFGVLGALLTIIPFIGITTGSLLPAAVALATMDSPWYALIIIFMFAGVQFLEGNFITPTIMGRRQNINPYMALLGLFFGGLIFGAIGVILAIPMLGIIKIICDDIDYLQPIGYLLGNPDKTLL